MIRILGLIFCGTAFLNCMTLLVVIQKLKDTYPMAPDWIVIWIVTTYIVGIVGLLFVVLFILEQENNK